MAVIPIAGRGGHTTYVVADESTAKAAVVNADRTTLAEVKRVVAQNRWVLKVELRCQHQRAPTIADTLLQPHRSSREGRVLLRSPVGPMRLRVPSDEDTLPPDGTVDTFVVRLGKLEVHALACSVRPPELAWRIGPAVFTNRLLYGEGIWPASATPNAVLRLPAVHAVYPRYRRGGSTVSTVGREREWELTWRTRGYDPSVPDPGATVTPTSRTRGPWSD